MDATRREVLAAGLVTGGAVALHVAEAPHAAAVRKDITDLERRAERQSPPVFLLESRVPDQFVTEAGSRLEISDARAKVGGHSLRWEHRAGAVLTVREHVRYAPSDYRAGDDQAWMGTVDTFSVWVHNAAPTQDRLRIEFGRGAGTDCWFDLNLDFTGWRTCWVRLGYDTQGTPRRGMNRVRFVAPDRDGVLFFDQVVLNAEMRPDHPTPDDQVPNVQPEIGDADNAHWLGLRQFRADLEKHPLTPSGDVHDVAVVRERLTGSLVGRPDIGSDALETLAASVDALGVPALGDGGVPAGPGAFVDGYQSAIWPPSLRSDISGLASVVKLRQYTDRMLAVAQAAHAARAEHAATADGFAALYVRMFVHLEDQGFAAGSAQGTIHHIGYQYRGFANSLLLARPVLEEHGLWERARSNVAWYFGLGRLTQTFEDPAHFGGLVDVLNTLLQGLVVVGLSMPTPAEQATVIAGVTRWLDRALTYSPGIEGGFKPDGTIFHHMGPYPDYARDAFIGMVPVLALLHGTAFGIGTPARRVVRTGLLTQRLHANTTQWPLSLTGRHPTGDKALNLRTFQNLAAVPAPDADEGYDAEVGAAFLRLLPASPTSSQKAFAAELDAAGISAEDAPAGNWQLGYAACGLHRRDEWLVTVRGHNRYLWSTEIYHGANVYGRYSTYATIGIQAGPPDATGHITHESNGYQQPGWDWNRWPGATTRHLPWRELAADLDGTIEQMVLTRSAFAGAGSWKGTHGVFGMHLMEHPFFDPTHTAKVSRFCFDDLVIAMGSDIANNDREHRTETTLYQVRIANGTASGDETTRSFTSGGVIVDPLGNGYYVPPWQKVHTSSLEQTAPDQTGTSWATAPYSTAVIPHGRAPRDAGYEYAILVQSGDRGAADFAARMRSNEPPYSVVRRDGGAHVVTHRGTGVRASVCFSGVEDLTGTVAATDAPCLLMERLEGDVLELSVTDPDLHLYDGEDPEQFDRKGRYTGRMTSYSRPWRRNMSAASWVTLTLTGRWSCRDDGVALVEHAESTALRVRCRHAQSRQLTLVRRP